MTQHKGMRRDNTEQPEPSTAAIQAQLDADIAEFLAKGGKVNECTQGETSLKYGISKNLLSYALRGAKANNKGAGK